MTEVRRFALLVAVLAISAGVWPEAQAPQQPPPAVGTGFIAGQVVDYPSGRPISNVTVGVIGRPMVQPGPPAGRGAMPTQAAVTTDAQGRFFFANLPAGTYQLQVAKPGYAQPPQSAGQMIELRDGDRVMDARLRLGKLGSLLGTLRDESGDPVVGTDVIALRRAVINGRPSLQMAGRNRSDDRGAFRISNLPGSDYVVCACSRDLIPFDPTLLTTLAAEPLQLMSVAARALTAGSDVVALDNTLRTYAPTFHQNSPSLSRATRVSLAWGDEKTGIDINLQLVSAARVSGRIVGASGPVHAQSMRLVPEADADAGASAVSRQPMLVQPDGRFDFATVPPGQYRLIVVQPDTTGGAGGPSGAALGFVGSRGAMSSPAGGRMSAGPPASTPPPLWANEPITVGDDGVTGLVVTLNRAPRINGRIEWIGAAPQPPAQVLNRITVVLQPLAFTDPFAGIIGVAIGRFSPDASFLVPGAVPGKYLLTAPPVPGFPTMKSMTVGGVDVTDLPFEVGEKDIADVVITFVDTPMASLTINAGQALPGSNTADDASYLVFPADRKYWTEPAASRRRFRNGLMPAKGIVTTPDLPAGDYFVAMVNGMEVVDWMEAGRLDTLSRRAQRVTVIDGAKASVEVRR